MITKIKGEQPFQVLTNNFSISPSQEGYTLQISADGVNFSNLFTVGAGVTRLVTGVAANSYYRLSGNESEVSINWMRVCVTEGGSGGSGATYTAGTYIDITQDVISVTGITPDLYLTSADTQNFATSTDVQSAYTILDDHITEVEEIAASGYTELHAGLLEVSGRTSLTSGDVQTQIDASISGKADAASTTPNSSSQLFPAWNSEGIITGSTSPTFRTTININDRSFERITLGGGNWYTGQFYAPESAGTAGQILTPSGNTPVWITPATINGSAITNGGNIEIQAGGDMSAYMTSGDAQVIATALVDLNDRVNTISAATPTVDLSGYYTSAQTEQAITSKNYVTSAQVETQITGKNYASSADVTTLVNSAFSYTNEIERVTASAYTELHDGLMEVSGRPVFNAAAYYTSAETEAAITGKNYVTSAQTETQITGKHYTTSSDQSVINIVKIEQTAYDTLVSQSATTSTTLYVVVPDSQ